MIGKQLIDDSGSGVDVVVDPVEKNLLWIYDEPFVITNRQTVNGNSFFHTVDTTNVLPKHNRCIQRIP